MTENLQDIAADSETIFDSMLFAVNDYDVPIVQLNLSSLSEREALATGIHGITAVGLGEERNRGLFGPIPVPYNSDFRSLIYVFHIKVKASDDPIILERGKFCAMFLIYKKEMIRFIANVYSMIESILNVYQENYLLNEENLLNDTIQYIYQELLVSLKIKTRIRLFRVHNGITVEFEESKIALGNELSLLIDERSKLINIYIPRNLDKDKRDHSEKIAKHLNKTEYQNLFTIKKMSCKKAFLALLKKNKVTILS